MIEVRLTPPRVGGQHRCADGSPRRTVQAMPTTRRPVAVLLAITAVLLVASPASAGVIFLPIGDYDHVDLGQTSAVAAGTGALRVTTRGLDGAGTIDCGGRTRCVEAGLDGSTVRVAYDLQLMVEPGEAGVRGRARGALTTAVPDLGPVELRGSIRGRARCTDGGPLPCDLAVEVRLRTPVTDASGERIGRLVLDLSGTIEMSTPDDVRWSELGGDGRLRVDV